MSYINIGRQLGEAANGIRHMTLLVPNVWSGDALCLHGLSAYVRLTLFRPHPTNGPNSGEFIQNFILA